MDEDLLYGAALHRADYATVGWNYGGISAHTHGPGDEYQESGDNSPPARILHYAGSGHSSDHFFLSLRERLENIRQRHLLIKLGVANGYGSLAGEDREGFQMVL